MFVEVTSLLRSFNLYSYYGYQFKLQQFSYLTSTQQTFEEVYVQK